MCNKPAKFQVCVVQGVGVRVNTRYKGNGIMLFSKNNMIVTGVFESVLNLRDLLDE